MFPIPKSQNGMIGNSKKSVSDIFNKRARKAHENRLSVSEADFGKIYGSSNFTSHTSCRTHLVLNQKRRPKSLCGSCCGKLDEKTLETAEQQVLSVGHQMNTDSSSKRSSRSDEHSLHTVEEEKPLKCLPKSFVESNRRLTNIVFHRPKRWASSVLKGGSKMNRKSVSESDFSKLYRDQIHSISTIGRPSPDLKVMSLERQRKAHPRRSWSLEQCPALFKRGSNVSLYEKSSSSQKLEKAKLEILNIKLSECKKDIEAFKSKFYSFKEEVHVGINKLYSQIKQDEGRYSNLCYRIDHITDLHQTQMRYFDSLIRESQNRDNKSIDTFLFDMLCDKINGIDKRISNLDL